MKLRARAVSATRSLPGSLFSFPLFSLLLTLVLAPSLHASIGSVRLPSDRDIYDRADVVVHGLVISSDSQVAADGSRVIVTVIEPLDVLKGGIDGNLILRETASAEDQVSAVSSAGLEYVPGHEVIVFASSRPAGDFETTGQRGGKFEVWRDATGHKYAVAELWRSPDTDAASSLSQAIPRLSDLGEFLNFVKNGAQSPMTMAAPVSDLQPVEHLSRTMAEDIEVTAMGRTAGTLTASSNPISVCDGSGLGATTISWKYLGNKSIDIRVGSTGGPLFAAGGASGSSSTGKWVSNGMKFYAMNHSTGATLGTLTVAVTCSAGYIGSVANPVQSCDGTGLASTDINWSFPGVAVVDVRLGSPAGTLFTRGASSGSATTGKWVTDGMAFYAVDSNTGASLGNFVESVSSTNCPTGGGTFPTAQKITALLPQISMARPGYLQASAVPGLSTSIMRISDRAVFGGSARVYRHFYSKRQPWNSDGTRLLLAHENTAYLLDGKSFKFLQAFTPWSDPVWSSTNPDILYGVASSPGGLIEYHVSTKSYRVIQSFPEWGATTIGVGEGNISDDNRYVALVGVTSTGVDVLVYDITNQRTVSRRAFPGPITLGRDIDWVGISPSGKYVVVCLNGTTKAHDVYDSQTMAFLRRLTPGSVTHGDLGYDTAGNEVLVTQNGSNAISSIRLADGVSRQEMSATAMASNQHISCRNSARHGYCYVSTYSDVWGVTQFMYREIFALKLDGSSTVERFSQSFAAALPVNDLQYDRQAQGVPSRDGSQVIFSSDWGDASSSAIIYDYVTGMKVTP